MPDDSNALPLGRVMRWTVVALLLFCGLALYFRAGLRLSPLTATAAANGVDANP
jgi:hypothetical protein